MSQTILIVEDEIAISSMIKFSLSRAGYKVIDSKDCSNALLAMQSNLPDLILIDWMLPDGSGLELARQIKNDDVTKHIGVIMLTAKAEEKDKVLGLESGADDYITKPFSQKELIARIKAVLRRTYGESDELVFGDIKFDLDSHQVFIKNKKVHIGRREYRLLRFLMQNNGKVYSRAQLLDHVWGQGNFFQERTVDVHIRRLRSLIENHKLGNLIQTVRGTGYGFNL